MSRLSDAKVGGFGRSELISKLVADNSKTHPDAFNFERGYFFYAVFIPDCAGIPASTGLTVRASWDNNNTFYNVYELNDPTTRWSKSALPTSGTLAFILTHAAGAQQLFFDFSNNVTEPTTIRVYGFDSTLGDAA